MNKLKVESKIISKFKGEINYQTVNNEDVYYTVSDILYYLTYMNIPFTRWENFIADLIKAFEELKSSAITVDDINDYTYVEPLIRRYLIKVTSIDELTNIISDIVENEEYTEFKHLYSKLKNGYYTS